MMDKTTFWSPPVDEYCQLKHFIAFVNKHYNTKLDDYPSLHAWSTEQLANFWSAVWDFCGVIGSKGDSRHFYQHHCVPYKSLFFAEATLNFAENLLQNNLTNETAIFYQIEDYATGSLCWQELRHQVKSLAVLLQDYEVGAGDRVVGIVCNTAEAVIAMLATTSLGAVWSSCSADFGSMAIVDRFQQINPKVLIAVEGYRFKSKWFDCGSKISQVAQQLPDCRLVIQINICQANNRAKEHPKFKPFEIQQPLINWQSAIQKGSTKVHTFAYQPMNFNDPLVILFSSGTTGLPKCIIHRIGGVLLEHLKEHQLHCDLRPADRLFYYTTCGWMMWNWQVSALASKASLVLYDGHPLAASSDILLEYTNRVSATLFGASSQYFETLMKHNVNPKQADFWSSLRLVTATGSPLLPECYQFIKQALKADVKVDSICGGTDLLGCFMLGHRLSAVYEGELQSASLGMQVDVFDQQGQSLIAKKGELVCRNAFPSMPIGFWQDKQHARFHQAYFSKYDNVWAHSDFVEKTANQGFIVYGRSDTTLNRGGVRIGTAEIYRALLKLEFISEAAAIGLPQGSDSMIVLFVSLHSGYQLNPRIEQQIKTTIGHQCSPRHVPQKIIEVAEMPKTRSGKLSELAIRDHLLERPLQNKNSLSNAECLALFDPFKQWYKQHK